MTKWEAATGSEYPKEENGNGGIQGLENGGAVGDLGIPAALSAFYSRYDHGNTSVKRPLRMRRDSYSSSRDGFPKGFSFGGPSSGLRTEGMVTQDSMEIPDLDTESPEYGSSGERTPEIGSFHLAQETGGEANEADDALRLNNNNTATLDPPKEETKRHMFSRRKKSSENVDTGKPPLKPKREGYITSRLFAKPLAARVCMLLGFLISGCRF